MHYKLQKPVDSCGAAAFFDSLRPGQLMEQLFDVLPDVYYFIKDRESRFVGGSRSFAKLMGERSVVDLLGKTDYDYSPEFLADAFTGDDRKVFEFGRPIRDKVELVPTADGSLDWLCTSKVPLFDHAGDVVGLAGITRIIRDSDSVYADHPEMQLIVDFIKARYREKLTMGDIAAVAGISVSSQERLFKKTFGITPLMYLRRTRLHAACRQLRETATPLAAIAIDCGFNDASSLSRAFRQELKITPLKYRQRFNASVRGSSYL
ncbi:MAG: helix-turn-helix domain-containing protein [Coraliomargarita sp.]